MAARPSHADQIDTRSWHFVGVPRSIRKAGTLEPIDLTPNYLWWLEGDDAEGEYLIYSAPEMKKVVVLLSDLNTAMHFKLRWA